MSTPKPADSKNDQKVEPQYLTLADKQPSLIRDAGNGSGRTISTGQLSDNLQKTRDGLINLMRNNDENDRPRRQGSDAETNDENNASQDAIRFEKSISDENDRRSGGLSGSSLVDITNKNGKLGGRGEFGSEEFAMDDPNRLDGLSSQNYGNGGSNMGKSGSRDAQQGKCRSNKNSNDDFGNNFGKDLDKQNHKLFSSQNPKKDGPLHSRIFIDVFLPSLEGNRIFPLYNYRCAEKIDRTSKDFYEKNRKRLNKQLLPVSSAGSIERESQSTTAQQTGKVVKLHSVQEVRNVEESREELQNIRELGSIEKVRNGDVIQNQESHQDLSGAEEIQETEPIQELEQQRVEVQRRENAGESEETEDIHEDEEPQEDGSPHPVAATKSDRPASADNPTEDNRNEATLNEEKKREAETVDRKIDHQQGDELLQKILRALMNNDELVDFFCEKVISKLAARNDFCGSNCKSTCGGLNKPCQQI